MTTDFIKACKAKRQASQDKSELKALKIKIRQTKSASGFVWQLKMRT
ncbi:hypothetical protein [Moraxella caviae]|nr:hypothetical protein [Moraxella caviae]